MWQQFLTTVAAFQQLEKLFVANHPVFDDFGKTIEKNTIAEGMEGLRVDENPLGLVKNTGQVFSLLQIHRHFSAYRAVYLG